MANNIKALVISSINEPSGIEFEWATIPSKETFIKQIKIPAISIDKDGNTTVDIGSIVSGMPSVFARANMFKNSFSFC